MNTDKNLIDKIIAEASLDARINNGVIDLNDFEHVKVIAEVMYDMCEDEDAVNEFLGKFMEEGKHPDRQAYNKEGWLVTFPSKEYRDAAIKKGTHSVSDPTHGKGGMNLYYKRKGKQKRQTQQATTAVKPDDVTLQPAKKPAAQPDTKKTPQTATSNQEGPLFSDITDDDVNDAPKQKAPEKTAPSPAPKQAASPEKPAVAQTTAPKEEPTAPAPKETPAIEVPVATTPPVEYANISKKFAAKKGWVAEQYGEYRDAQGNTVAVVGLSGEVVPVRSNDREEYKLFVEKNMP